MSEDAARASLVLRIHLHEARYHGGPEWPPSPARAFQALVAAAGKGRGLLPDTTEALGWLESLPPPHIGAPHGSYGATADLYVPNNDLDSKGGDPAKIGEIRTKKTFTPRLLQPDVPFLYIWKLSNAEDTQQAPHVCTTAESLYQFGRGVDLAWATARVVDQNELANELARYPGRLLRPAPGRGSHVLQCPQPGSLDRLEERFEAMAQRFGRHRVGKTKFQGFSQPPMAHFRSVEYGGDGALRVLELRDERSADKWAPLALCRAHDLVTRVRDALLDDELLGGLGEDARACVLGRTEDGSHRLGNDARLQLIPIPSIGHEHADLRIRRLMVRVPQSAPTPGEDIDWALGRVSPSTGSVLVAGRSGEMAAHYTGAGRRWRTVTAAALPRRIHRRSAKHGSGGTRGVDERSSEERNAFEAVRAALRHAGLMHPARTIRVQREPFFRNGTRAEDFAAGTRFAREQMWHVDVEFGRAVEGPLVIGNGRFLGLGVMHAVSTPVRAISLEVVEGLTQGAALRDVTNALRRATLARCQALVGPGRSISPLISGHDEGGRPAHDPRQVHYCFDPDGRRLVLFLRAPEDDRAADRVARQLQSAMDGFTLLRAGRAGLLTLVEQPLESDDPLLRPHRTWRTVSSYAVNKHRALGSAHAAVEADVRASCATAELPDPLEVTISNLGCGSGRGLTAEVQLRFATEVRGPILLGRTRFKGGGLFTSSPAGAK